MKNIACIWLTFLWLTFLSFGQEQANQRLAFGINGGVNHSFAVSQTNQNSSSNIQIKDELGFSLGILADIKLKNRFYISPRVELNLNNASYRLHSNTTIHQQEIRPRSLEFKTYFTFLRKQKNTSSYFFAGPNYRFAINTNPTPTKIPGINDLTLDIGFGIRNHLQHFVFSPEIRYSFGFKSISIHPEMMHIKMHAILLVFNLSE